MSQYLQLFESGKYSDLIIKEVNGEKERIYKTHKCIVSTGSEFVQTALDSDLPLIDDNILTINTANTTFGLLEYIIRYLYGQAFDFKLIQQTLEMKSIDVFSELYRLCDMLLIKNSCKVLENSIMKDLSIKDRFSVYQSLLSFDVESDFFHRLENDLIVYFRKGEIGWLSKILLDENYDLNQEIIKDEVMSKTITHLVAKTTQRILKTRDLSDIVWGAPTEGRIIIGAGDTQLFTVGSI